MTRKYLSPIIFRVAKPSGRRGLFALLAIGLLAAGVAGFFTSGAVAQAQEQETALPSNYDTDGDGLIEIGSLDQLNAVRWDLDGNGVPSTGNEDAYADAFPVADEGSVCPADTTCTGFELMANLDFDKNGDGEITEVDSAYWNDGQGWEPIGGFSGVFQGNGHTIANLFIDRAANNVGLFGSLVNKSTVRNLALTGVSVRGQNYVGGLVGSGTGGPILASHAEGSANGGYYVGGLVGYLYGELSSSYFDTQTSGRAVAVGNDDADNSGAINGDETASAGATAQTTAALQSSTGYTGIYSDWNLTVYAGSYPYQPWDFGAEGGLQRRPDPHLAGVRLPDAPAAFADRQRLRSPGDAELGRHHGNGVDRHATGFLRPLPGRREDAGLRRKFPLLHRQRADGGAGIHLPGGPAAGRRGKPAQQ